MSGILDLLNSDLGKQIISGVSSDSNQSESKTADVMSMALPLLMGAMKKNATTPEGAEGLMNALNTKHDGSILDNLGSLFEGGVDNSVKQDGAGILKHVLGNSENNVTNAISQKSGLDTSSVMNILKVAAPLVLGYLGKQQKQQQVQSSSGIEGLLGGILGGDNKQQSMIESLLDGNNDGSVIDDLAGMFLGGSKGKSGGLGSLLGGFLK
ncbi:MAG: hypothetical protein COB12_01520 [Flavobacterium sp.]|nr:MAG: hypothetical protein COB12_01520 [Flavobacterium sp.]